MTFFYVLGKGLKLGLFAALVLNLNGNAFEVNGGLDGLVFVTLLALIVSLVTIRARRIEEATRQPLRNAAA